MVILKFFLVTSSFAASGPNTCYLSNNFILSVMRKKLDHSKYKTWSTL